MSDEFPRCTTRHAPGTAATTGGCPSCTPPALDVTEHKPHSETQPEAAIVFREPEPIGFTRHEAAVRRTMEWADEAAARQDFAGALEWLAVLEAIGEPLPHRYQRKQATWAHESRSSAQ